MVGLHPDFEQVRVNIIGNESLPSLNEAYAYLHHEEKMCSTMSQFAPVERSALITSTQQGDCGGSGMHGHGSGRFGGTPDNRDKLKCEHFVRLLHTKDTCWDLHERPTEMQ